MFITNILKRIRSASPKQLVIASAFVVALAGAISLGHATRQTTYAADCSSNAILLCGATDANNFIDKVSAGDENTKGIYHGFGLQREEYDRFRSESKRGIAYKDGTIKVDGVTIATNAWSIGRNKKPKSFDWHGLWADYAQDVFMSNEIPVMVLFDANGEMEFAVMNDCGNPKWGDVVKNSFECKSLTKSAVAGERDTYLFTVDAPHSANVSINKVVYNYGDGTTETKTDLSPVKHKFTKPGNYTVKVSVTFNLPGGKVRTIESVHCQTMITVVAPYYKCVQLMAVALNQKKTQFRFTVKTSQGNGATLKDVDFTLDGKATSKGVATKDQDGNIYNDYSFSDNVKHTIVAKVNFNVAEGVQSVTCQANVTPEKQPVCEVPGKGHLPPESPECAYCPIPGKENLPKDSDKCKEVPPTPPVLPSTGVGSVFGLFAGTSALGAVAHRIVSNRRRS